MFTRARQKNKQISNVFSKRKIEGHNQGIFSKLFFLGGNCSSFALNDEVSKSEAISNPEKAVTKK